MKNVTEVFLSVSRKHFHFGWVNSSLIYNIGQIFPVVNFKIFDLKFKSFKDSREEKKVM